MSTNKDKAYQLVISDLVVDVVKKKIKNMHLKVLYHNTPPKVEISNESHILLYVREGSDLER